MLLYEFNVVHTQNAIINPSNKSEDRMIIFKKVLGDGMNELNLLLCLKAYEGFNVE